MPHNDCAHHELALLGFITQPAGLTLALSSSSAYAHSESDMLTAGKAYAICRLLQHQLANAQAVPFHKRERAITGPGRPCGSGTGHTGMRINLWKLLVIFSPLQLCNLLCMLS